MILALVAASILGVNHYYSGKSLVSLYALSAAGGAATEFAMTPAGLFHNAVSITRWGIQRTVLYTVPFCFVMVFYALFRNLEADRDHHGNTVFVFTILLYSVESFSTASFNGERYYFEPFLWICIVAARGFVLLADRWRPSGVVVSTMIWALTGLQLFEHAVALPVVREILRYQRSAEASWRRCTNHIPERTGRWCVHSQTCELERSRLAAC